jgi:oryzin
MQLFSRFLALAAAVSPLFSNAAPVSKRSADVIPGRYIVQFMPDTNTTSIAAHHNTVRSLTRRDDEATVEREFDLGDFKGYVGSFDAATADALNALPEVNQYILDDEVSN